MTAATAIVVGAGVSGLTTACALQDVGWSVAVWTADEPARTTSAVAAAIWYPYRASPRERVLAWGRRAYERFARLAPDPTTGVRLRAGVEVSRSPVAAPWWSEAVPGTRPARLDELPVGFEHGVHARFPVIEMPVYLGWLLRRFQDRGGDLHLRALDDLTDAGGSADVVVNCSGLGARTLADDASVIPVRGQVVRVVNLGIERFVLHEEDDRVTYVIPRSRDVVLGGTAEEGSWDTAPDPVVADDIRRRAAALEPRLRGAAVLGHAAGLRPARPTVRVEREVVRGTTVVHNYGHGGAGVTLSWGCAEEVVALVDPGQRPLRTSRGRSPGR